MTIHTRWIVGFFLILTGMVLRFYTLIHDDLWFDEIYAVITSRNDSLLTIIINAITDLGPPPLYYLLLHFWMNFFGESVLTIRSLSLLFSVLCLPMIFIISETFFSKRVAIMSTLFATLSLIHIHYAQEARPYSLFSFLSLLSMYYFYKATKQATKWVHITYIVTTILMLYTHFYGLFIFITQVVYLLWLQKSRNINVKNLYISTGVILLTYLPWLLVLLLQMQFAITRGLFIPQPTLNTVFSIITNYFNGVFLFFFLGILVIGFYRSRNLLKNNLCKTFSSDALLLILFWLLISLLFPILLSYVTTPFLLLRYTLPTSFALYILVSYVLSRFSYRYTILAVILLSIFSFASLTKYYSRDVTITLKPQWSEISAHVDNQADKNDLIIIEPQHEKLSFNYYSQRDDLLLRGFHSDVIRFDGNTLSMPVSKEQLFTLQSLIVNRSSFWLILDPRITYKPQLFTIIEKDFPEVETKHFHGMSVYRFKKYSPSLASHKDSRQLGIDNMK